MRFRHAVQILLICCLSTAFFVFQYTNKDLTNESSIPLHFDNRTASHSHLNGEPFTCPVSPPLPKVLPQLLIETRNRFATIIREYLAERRESVVGRVLLLVGAKKRKRDEHGGMEWKFEQRSHFRYLFGDGQEDCLGFLDLASGAAVVLAPLRDDNGVAFYGPHLQSIPTMKEQYHIDSIFPIDELHNVFKKFGTRWIYCPDANELAPHLESSTENPTVLPWEVAEHALNLARKQKTPSEKLLIEYALRVSVAAHRGVYHALRRLEGEGKLSLVRESALQYYFVLLTASCGCAEQAYTPMVASGSHANVLDYEGLSEVTEYGVNTDFINRPKSHLVLVDAGALCRGYAADITRTYLLLGREEKVSRMINLVHVVVREANRFGVAMVKPGILWRDLENGVRACLLDGLVRIGLVTGSIYQSDEFKDPVINWFMPHTVAHPLGLLVHDPPEGDVIMSEMYLTVEPGIYFFPHLIDRLESQPSEGLHAFLNSAILLELRDVGGIRIEDVVFVSSTSQVMTRELSDDLI